MAANKACLTRLQKEYKTLLREPVPHITAHPSHSLLEWHFVLSGAKGTDYEGGVYHGKLVFPPQYPFKPPSISLFTPNGRFATNTKLCLSMTDYHPESWNPMWSVGTILNGLLSFMYDSQPTTGSVTSTKAEKQKLAQESLAFNMKNATFRKLFPDWVEEHARRDAAATATDNAAVMGTQTINQQGEHGVTAAAPNTARQGGPRAATAGAGGQVGTGSSLVTVAVVLVVFAIAVVPLLSGGKGALGAMGAR